MYSHTVLFACQAHSCLSWFYVDTFGVSMQGFHPIVIITALTRKLSLAAENTMMFTARTVSVYHNVSQM